MFYELNNVGVIVSADTSVYHSYIHLPPTSANVL